MTSQVQEFYKGKNIFLTGGTGFLGIAIIEKLLRTCPDIASIYLLMRPKKGMQIEDRLTELTKNKVGFSANVILPFYNWIPFFLRRSLKSCWKPRPLTSSRSCIA